MASFLRIFNKQVHEKVMMFGVWQYKRKTSNLRKALSLIVKIGLKSQAQKNEQLCAKEL